MFMRATKVDLLLGVALATVVSVGLVASALASDEMTKASGGTRTAAGHSDTFRPGTRPGTLLKLAAGAEEENLKILMNDKLASFVPKLYGASVAEDGQRYLEIQDLTQGFAEPSIMDIKMGCRTFAEEEVVKVMTKTAEPKAHYYEKMMREEPAALSERERIVEAVTKARYMQWRDQATTTAQLGFRVEGIMFGDGSSKRNELKTVRQEEQVLEVMREFLAGENGGRIREQYLNRLRNIRRVIVKSRFFMNHEFIGSSLLFVHDQRRASVWMIDLVQTHRLPDDIEVSHASQWRMGNHEDCYLTGLDNLIHIINRLS